MGQGCGRCIFALGKTTFTSLMIEISKLIAIMHAIPRNVSSFVSDGGEKLAPLGETSLYDTVGELQRMNECIDVLLWAISDCDQESLPTLNQPHWSNIYSQAIYEHLLQTLRSIHIDLGPSDPVVHTSIEINQS